MKVEKISDNKLKVILSAEDMIEYNFTFDNFLYDDREINTMFRRIASIAAKEAGIVTDNCKFFIEALKKDTSTVVLIITKEPVCSNIQKRYKFKKNDGVLFKTIFVFKGINDFICFAKSNLFYCYLFEGKNSLYRVGNDLILEIALQDELNKYEKVFCNKISEYSVEKRKSELYLPYIKEYGKVIIKDSALKTVYYEM